MAQVLRSVVRPDQRDWEEKLPMVEFTLNSATSLTTGLAPFKVSQGYLPRMTQALPEGELLGVQAFAQNALDNLQQAHDTIIEGRVFQTYHANRCRQDKNLVRGKESPIKEGEKVYLSTANLNLPKGRAKKLLPRFIGPYKVLRARPETSNYTLELPDDLCKRKIHPTFHISRLWRHEPNDEKLFPNREAQVFYDLGMPADAEWYVDHIMEHRGKGRTLRFRVKWSLGDETWEPLANVDDLSALDEYLETQGVSRVGDLVKV